jgi:hypothetical protein
LFAPGFIKEKSIFEVIVSLEKRNLEQRKEDKRQIKR